MRSRAVPIALALALAAVGCGGDPETPEAQVRRALGALEAAAEEGDLAAFRDGISERYADERGHDKEALVRFATFHVLRSARRHVLVRVRDVLLRDDGRAEVSLAVGLAGSPAASADELARLRADVYKVDLDLAQEDGAWRVVWAQWRPTAPADLL